MFLSMLYNNDLTKSNTQLMARENGMSRKYSLQSLRGICVHMYLFTINQIRFTKVAKYIKLYGRF